jgi:hypothetical protein
MKREWRWIPRSIIPYPDAAAPLKAHVEEVIAAAPADATDPQAVATRTAARPN